LVGLDAPILDSARGGSFVTSRLEILEGPVLDSARGGGLITPLWLDHMPRLLNQLVRSVGMCLGTVDRFYQPPQWPTKKTDFRFVTK
jgi:hypothetical protein